MPHNFNRSAFETVKSSTNALLAAYASLVVIELALKDRAAAWKNGHFIEQWLTEEGDAGLTSLTQQLSGSLLAMKTTDRNGNSSPLRLDSYPELRYLRHDSDYPGESTDKQLSDSLALIRDIEAVLRGKGII